MLSVAFTTSNVIKCSLEENKEKRPDILASNDFWEALFLLLTQNSDFLIYQM